MTDVKFLENLTHLFELAGGSVGISLVLAVLIKKVYAYVMRKRPVKVIRKYAPDGTLLESIDEYRP